MVLLELWMNWISDEKEQGIGAVELLGMYRIAVQDYLCKTNSHAMDAGHEV